MLLHVMAHAGYGLVLTTLLLRMDRFAFTWRFRPGGASCRCFRLHLWQRLKLPRLHLIDIVHRRIDREKELRLIVRLQQIIERMHGNRLPRIVKLIKGRQKEDGTVPILLTDLLRCLQSRDARHLDVQQ